MFLCARVPQQVCGVIRHGDFHASPIVQFASKSANRNRGVQQRGCGDQSQTANELGANDFELLLEKGAAILSFFRLGISVAGRTTTQDIHDVHIFTSERAGFDDFRKQLARFANERFAHAIFIGPRGFAEEN